MARRLLLGGLALVAAVGAGAWFGLGPDPAIGADSTPPGEMPEAAQAITPLEEIVVDISARTVTGAPSRRFLKLNLALVHDAAAAETLAARRIHLRDAFVDYLRHLDEADLAGSAGLARLRADLLLRARVVGGTDGFAEILIADLVIQ